MRQSKSTILLVDDEPSVLRSTARILERDGYRVFEASDGPQALDLWRNNSGEIDLLITDFRMPGMNGLELATAIDAISPGVEVIFISAYPGHFENENKGRVGGARLLAKPFSRDGLLQLVAEVLNPSDDDG